MKKLKIFLGLWAIRLLAILVILMGLRYILWRWISVLYGGHYKSLIFVLAETILIVPTSTMYALQIWYLYEQEEKCERNDEEEGEEDGKEGGQSMPRSWNGLIFLTDGEMLKEEGDVEYGVRDLEENKSDFRKFASFKNGGTDLGAVSGSVYQRYYPYISLLIPCYNEPEIIIEKTVKAAMAVDYPSDRFQIILCDDSRRNSLKNLIDQCNKCEAKTQSALAAKAAKSKKQVKDNSKKIVKEKEKGKEKQKGTGAEKKKTNEKEKQKRTGRGKGNTNAKKKIELRRLFTMEQKQEEKEEEEEGEDNSLTMTSKSKPQLHLKLQPQPQLYYVVREEHIHAKAGNLNNTLFHSGLLRREDFYTDFVLVLDCDMQPKQDIIINLLPQFFESISLPSSTNKVVNDIDLLQVQEPQTHKKENRSIQDQDMVYIDINSSLIMNDIDLNGNIDKDKCKNVYIRDHKVAMVQSPQSFYNVLPNDELNNQQMLFYQVLLPGWANYNCTPCCGTNVMFSLDALLSINGFIYGSITEDFLTSMIMTAHGYKMKYIKTITAKGLAPTTISDFYIQRFRWAYGALQIFRDFNPLLRCKSKFGLRLPHRISHKNSSNSKIPSKLNVKDKRNYSGQKKHYEVGKFPSDVTLRMTIIQKLLYFWSGFNYILSIPIFIMVLLPIFFITLDINNHKYNSNGGLVLPIASVLTYLYEFLPYFLTNLILSAFLFRTKLKLERCESSSWTYFLLGQREAIYMMFNNIQACIWIAFQIPVKFKVTRKRKEDMMTGNTSSSFVPKESKSKEKSALSLSHLYIDEEKTRQRGKTKISKGIEINSTTLNRILFAGSEEKMPLVSASNLTTKISTITRPVTTTSPSSSTSNSGTISYKSTSMNNSTFSLTNTKQSKSEKIDEILSSNFSVDFPYVFLHFLLYFVLISCWAYLLPVLYTSIIKLVQSQKDLNPYNNIMDRKYTTLTATIIANTNNNNNNNSSGANIDTAAGPLGSLYHYHPHYYHQQDQQQPSLEQDQQSSYFFQLSYLDPFQNYLDDEINFLLALGVNIFWTIYLAYQLYPPIGVYLRTYFSTNLTKRGNQRDTQRNSLQQHQRDTLRL